MKQNIIWYGIGGVALGIGLYFVQPKITLVTPWLVKTVFFVGLGLLAFVGLMKLALSGKEFLEEWKK